MSELYLLLFAALAIALAWLVARPPAEFVVTVRYGTTCRARQSHRRFPCGCGGRVPRVRRGRSRSSRRGPRRTDRARFLIELATSCSTAAPQLVGNLRLVREAALAEIEQTAIEVSWILPIAGAIGAPLQTRDFGDHHEDRALADAGICYSICPSRRQASCPLQRQGLQRLGRATRRRPGRSRTAPSSAARSTQIVPRNEFLCTTKTLRRLRAEGEVQAARRQGEGQRRRAVPHQAHPEAPRGQRLPGRHRPGLLGRPLRRVAPQQGARPARRRR